MPNIANTESIIKQIEQIDALQLNDIIDAVMKRYNALHTDREAGFLSLPLESQARAEALENITRFIRVLYK